MSHLSHRLLVAVTFALALTACSRGERDAASAAEAPATATEASNAPSPRADSASSTTSDATSAANPRAPATYTCDNGSKVEIADLVAIVTLKDGRAVQIARDPDDAFNFQGEALSFRMKDGQGELAQDEGATSRCAGG